MRAEILFNFQDNYNVLHISAMYSREDVVKLLLTKRGVDPYSTGGVSIQLKGKTRGAQSNLITPLDVVKSNSDVITSISL
jgi:ankyrin repeat protein